MAAAVVAAARVHTTASDRVVPFDETLSSTSRQDSPAKERANWVTGAVAEWSVSDVSTWLLVRGHKDLADATQKSQIDGGTLIELDAAGWSELGVSSAVQRAKLLSAVKQAAVAETNNTFEPGPSVMPQYARPTKRSRKAEKELSKHFVDGFSPRTPDMGTEHTPSWALCVANGNSNPAEVKQHYLRFMGVYNVIDLLVLTINMAYLMSADLSGVGPDSWASVVIITFQGTAAMMAGFGMVSSTILYNTASAVSDANFIVFAKLPSTLRYMKLINDLSIFSGNATSFMSVPFFLYRIVVDHMATTWVMYPGGPDIEGKWYYALPALVVPMATMLWAGSAWMHNLVQCTHQAMYGGLFSSEPIAMLVDDPTWPYRCSPEQLEEHINTKAVATGRSKKPTDCEAEAATMYAEQTAAHLTTKGGVSGVEDFFSGGAPTGEAGMLLSSLTSIVALAGGNGAWRGNRKSNLSQSRTNPMMGARQ